MQNTSSKTTMGTTLPLLAAYFDGPLQPWEIPQFRGAIVHKIGLEHELFHNHRNTGQGPRFHYHYPLIQYKLDKGRPLVLCLGPSVSIAEQFFAQSPCVLEIGPKRLPLKLMEIKTQKADLQITAQPFKYQLHQWLALNQENYQKYQQLPSLAQQYQFLDSLLLNNIRTFAKGMGWTPPAPIQVAITKALNLPQHIPHKGARRLAFHLQFTCNLTLPDFIGLGKGTSHGFGVIRRVPHPQQQSPQ